MPNTNVQINNIQNTHAYQVLHHGYGNLSHPTLGEQSSPTACACPGPQNVVLLKAEPFRVFAVDRKWEKTLGFKDLILSLLFSLAWPHLLLPYKLAHCTMEIGSMDANHSLYSMLILVLLWVRTMALFPAIRNQKILGNLIFARIMRWKKLTPTKIKWDVTVENAFIMRKLLFKIHILIYFY